MRLPRTIRIFAALIAVIVMVPCAYILSCGPVFRFWGGMSPDQATPLDMAIGDFYSPMVDLADESTTPAARLLRKYLRLWGVDSPEPKE
jgi:hypothetical protein